MPSTKVFTSSFGDVKLCRSYFFDFDICYDLINKATTYDNRAYAYEQLNQTEKAIKDYQQSLKLDPKNQSAQIALDRLAKK